MYVEYWHIFSQKNIDEMIDHSQLKQIMVFFGASGSQKVFHGSLVSCQVFTVCPTFDKYVRFTVAIIEYIFCYDNIDELKVRDET